MNEVSTEKITAPKLLVFIGMLYTLALGVSFFYLAIVFPLYVLIGIICLVIAFLIFVSLGLINFGPLKILYQWWLLLIYSVVLFEFAVIFQISNYLPPVFLGMAAFIELIMQKEPYKASKMVTLVGVGISTYECFILFFSGSPFNFGNPIFIVNGFSGLVLNSGNPINITNGIIGLILLAILLLIIIRRDNPWWIVFLIGFVIFMWVSPQATFLWPNPTGLGFGGTIILIASLLILLGL